MVHITHLPSGPEPKKLTAYSPTRTLLEHQLAFWAQNNKGDSLTEKMSEEQVQTLWDALQAMAQRPMVHIGEFNELSCPLRWHYDMRNDPERRKEAPPHYAITKSMLARMLGYKDYPSVKYYLTKDKYIINRRNALVPLQESFYKNDTTLVSMPKKKVIDLFQKNEALRVKKMQIDALYPSQVSSIAEAERIIKENYLRVYHEKVKAEEEAMDKRNEERKRFRFNPIEQDNVAEEEKVLNFKPNAYIADASVPVSEAPLPKAAPVAPTWEELRAQHLASQQPIDPTKEK
jgi:hypothetical protein